MADTQNPAPKPLRSSPHKPTVTGTEQYAFVEPKLEDKRAKMCLELSGHFVGEMPTDEMLKTFLPLPASRAGQPIPRGDFSQMVFNTVEKDMYDPIVAAITDSGCCPSFTLNNTSTVKDENTGLGPDLMLFADGEYEEAVEDNRYFARVEVIVEVKPSRGDDAFVSKANDRDAVQAQANAIKENPILAATTEKGFSNRGQQIDYATNVMTFQHRTHIFTVSVIGRMARILRWDRSGTVVSAAFDYVDTNFLMEFFYRYEHATPEQRGHDTSVLVPSKKQIKDFEKAVRAFVKKFPKDDPLFNLHDTLDPSRPTRKLRVYDDASGTTSEYVVRKPFFDPMSMIGRGTRGYLAWGISEGRLVFVKDSWRTEIDDVLTELEVYKLLLSKYATATDSPKDQPSPANEAGSSASGEGSKDKAPQQGPSPFPHLPKVLKCGDVRDANGDTQHTVVQDHLRNRNEWARPAGWIRHHVHIRIVQELLIPLHMVKDSKQLVQAIRDVLELIRRVYHEGHVLHRDISAGNVMLDSETFRGILNDWDHAIKTNITSEGHPYRTGTWQFMSIAILRDPTKPHEIHDDIESCFWVLFYIAMHQFRVVSGSVKLTILDESEETYIDGQLLVTGGLGKREALFKHIPKLQFHSEPLTYAIRYFAKTLNAYHHAKEAVEQHADSQPGKQTGEVLQKAMEKRNQIDAEDWEADQKKFEKNRERLERVLVAIEVLDEALAMDNWPENDAVPNQHPKQTALDVRKVTHQLKESGFIRSQPELLKLSRAEQIRSHPDRPFPPSAVPQSNIFPPAGSFTIPPLAMLPQHASPMVSQSSIGEKRRQPDEPTEEEDEDRGEGSSNGRLQRSRSPTKKTKTETETKAPGTETRKSSSRKPSAERSRKQTRSQNQPRTISQEGVRTRAQVKKSLGVERARTRSQSRELGLIN